MYSDTVQEHATNPRNMGPLEQVTHRGLCGEPGEGPYMLLEFLIEADRIKQAAFQTYGCPAAIACGSMTTLILTGRTIEQALRLDEQDLSRLLGGLPEGKEHCLRLAIQAIKNAFNTNALERSAGK